MNVSKTQAILIVSYVVTFAAGAVMGLVWGLPEGAAGGRRPRFFDLDLTPEQSQRLEAIWSETVRKTMRQCDQDQRQAIEGRDEAVEALLEEEQKQAYDTIYEGFFSRLDEVRERRRQAFETANQRTREILTESQREKFDEMLERRREHVRRHPGRRHPGGLGRRGRPPGGRGPRRPPREEGSPPPEDN